MKKRKKKAKQRQREVKGKTQKLQIAKLNQFYIPVYDYTRSPGSALKLRVIVSYMVAIATK